MNERNEQLAERQDLNIEIDPKILAIIQASTAISTSTGSSAHLLKVGSKRRRTRAEIEEFRMQQASRLNEIEQRDERIRELE